MSINQHQDNSLETRPGVGSRGNKSTSPVLAPNAQGTPEQHRVLSAPTMPLLRFLHFPWLP